VKESFGQEVLLILQRGSMLYFVVIGLTLLSSWAIINLIAKRKRKKYAQVLYRQSDLHKVMKRFFSYPLEDKEKPLTQSEKRNSKDKINVLVIDEEAYWVSDNTFFIAKAEDGQVMLETAEPINTKDMSKKDIDKMLFILDNLQGRDANDSGSSGNERL
jgi:hypothetical protein